MLERNSELLGNRNRTAVLVAIRLLGETWPSELASLLGLRIYSVQRILEAYEREGVLVSRTMGRTRRVSLNPRYVAHREASTRCCGSWVGSTSSCSRYCRPVGVDRGARASRGSSDHRALDWLVELQARGYLPRRVVLHSSSASPLAVSQPMTPAALEEWGRTLADLGIGASLVDRQLRLSWCNRLLQEQFEQHQGDGGEHCFAVHWSRKQRCSDCLPLLVFQTGEPHQGYRERHRPGQPRKMFRVGAAPIHDPAGQVTHVMETFVDVTELGAAIASGRLENRLSASLAAAGHGVLVVDARGRIVSWSTGMDAILGHRASDVLGRGAALLLPEDSRGADFWSQLEREPRELLGEGRPAGAAGAHRLAHRR